MAEAKTIAFLASSTSRGFRSWLVFVFLIFAGLSLTWIRNMKLKSPSPLAPHAHPVWQDIHELAERIHALEEDQVALAAYSRSLRAMIGSLSCKLNGVGPKGGFCLEREQANYGGNHNLDEGFSTVLVDLFQNKTVLDVGAGVGHYGQWFKDNAPSIIWQGIDGSENIDDATDGRVKFVDLTEVTKLPKVDWVMSVEVGEHIPKQHENAFVDLLCYTARDGVVLTWARPGQGGYFHINEKSREDVIHMVASRGMHLDEAYSKRLREAASVEWLKNNSLVFRWLDNELKVD